MYALANKMYPVNPLLIIKVFELFCERYEERVGYEKVVSLDFVLLNDSHCSYKLTEMNVVGVRKNSIEKRGGKSVEI